MYLRDLACSEDRLAASAGWTLDCCRRTGSAAWDPTRRALVSGLRHFTNEIGALLLAEGIETVEELDTLSSLGVDLGQGYLLGRPLPLAEIVGRGPLVAAR